MGPHGWGKRAGKDHGLNLSVSFTLLARFSTSEIMEFLKSVAAVSGRLVTSVMLSFPSGHIFFSTWLELDTLWIQNYQPLAMSPKICACLYVHVSPIVQQPLKILEECVLVLVYEADH